MGVGKKAEPGADEEEGLMGGLEAGMEVELEVEEGGAGDLDGPASSAGIEDDTARPYPVSCALPLAASLLCLPNDEGCSPACSAVMLEINPAYVGLKNRCVWCFSAVLSRSADKFDGKEEGSRA